MVTLSPYAQISETTRGSLIAKIIFRHPLLHKLEFATDNVEGYEMDVELVGLTEMIAEHLVENRPEQDSGLS